MNPLMKQQGFTAEHYRNEQKQSARPYRSVGTGSRYCCLTVMESQMPLRTKIRLAPQAATKGGSTPLRP